MKVQEGIESLCCFLGFVLLLLTLLSTRVASRWEDQEFLLAYLIDAGVINQEMAELLQVHCMLELLQARNTLRNLESNFTEKPNLSKQDMINAILPEVNQILVNCASEKKSGHHYIRREEVSDETSDSWHLKYLWFLFNQQSSPTRRSLAETPLEAPAPSPTFSSPSPAPLPTPLAPAEVPASPPLVPSFPPSLNDMTLPPTNTEDASAPDTGVYDVTSNVQDSNQRTVVIAVVVTAFLTLVMAALIFVCWRRCCRPRSRSSRNDERLLLSLSMSDYSISSSSPKVSFEASVIDQKLSHTNNQSFKKMNHSNSGKVFVESHPLSHLKNDAPVIATVNSSENQYAAMSGAPGMPLPPGRTLPPKPPPSPISPAPGLPLPPGRTLPPKPPPSHISPTAPPPPRGPPPPPLPIPNGGHRPPPPPPPPVAPRPPPPPPLGVPKPPPPIASKSLWPLNTGPRASSSNEEEEAGTNKAKLKPFFWDKVLANPDQSMVWHRIKTGSFQFSEEMIESLFGYSTAPGGRNNDDGKKKSSSEDAPAQNIQIIDARKAQNLAILLKALNVTTEEVCDALEEGNELPSELIQTLLKMAPTAEEELKLRLYSGQLSHLGPAERFLKVLVDIPFAFKRLESLLFMCTLQEETTSLKEGFGILEAACTELRKSRLFLKLLEAVLKTGNRMNDGTFRGGAQAFKLETLLKLSDVKGTDGKTTLLHFVVQEIIRSEGIRAARAAKPALSSSSFNSDDQALELDTNQDSDEHLRSLGLEAVSGLGNELKNVKRAAAIDADSFTGTISKLGHATKKARDFMNSDMKNFTEGNGFRQTLRSFVQSAEVDIGWAREEEKRIMAMVKSTVDYFHGNSAKDEGLRLFAVVRDFLIILDKVCGEVKKSPQRFQTYKKEDTTAAPPDPRQRLVPAITNRRVDSSSSDDDES